MTKPLRVLVFGGTRLIGLEVVDELLTYGHEVTVFNRGTRTISWEGPVREMRGDRNVPADLAPLAELELDGVVDLSGYDPQQVAAGLDVIVGARRYVHCSSAAVYAPDPVLPFTEATTPTGPGLVWSRGDYSRRKLAGEMVLRERRDSAESTVILRPPYVLAPANSTPREEWVLNRLLDEEEVLVPGDGLALAHFVSARQIAQSVRRALEGFSDGGVRVFNVADPGAVASAVGFVVVCAEIAGVTPRVRRVIDDAGPIFNAHDCVFPFPNDHLVVDTRAAEVAGVLGDPAGLRSMVVAAHRDLLAHPERRVWRRSAAELRALGAMGR